ncbi:MAG: hypothetical protein REJ23_07855, partial [Brevundimonas sp.]|nr:hypothetical protein [Brevundimonas sp.]
TGSTIMASERLRVTPFIVGRILNHTTERGGAAAVTVSTYALYDFMAEKRQALNAWDALLHQILAAGASRRDQGMNGAVDDAQVSFSF